MNLKLFLIINGWAGHWPILDALMVFCAHYLIYVMVAIVFGYALFGYRRWRDMALVSIITAGVARFVVAEIIRLFYQHARPDPAVLTKLQLLIPRDFESSFPSGHTIFVFALATIVYFHNKRAGRWFFAMAALVGFARVYVGVHWPYDIVGGIVLGILTAWVCDKIYRKFFKPQVEKLA
jgi:undecaprenyl-diphosphatase